MLLPLDEYGQPRCPECGQIVGAVVEYTERQLVGVELRNGRWAYEFDCDFSGVTTIPYFRCMNNDCYFQVTSVQAKKYTHWRSYDLNTGETISDGHKSSRIAEEYTAEMMAEGVVHLQEFGVEEVEG